MHDANAPDQTERLRAELQNFETIARRLAPQPVDVPQVPGIELHGGTMALNGEVGGDHLIYVDFARRYNLDARIVEAEARGAFDVARNLRRCRHCAGIALIDVSGHHVTDALPAAMLHQAFLLGAVYELDISGHITRRLFEHLNTRFHESGGEHKFMSVAYGEISDDAMFRFLSAAQPFPLVFSAAHDRFMDVPPALCVSFPPLGLLPSFDGIDRTSGGSVLGFKERYQMNEWVLMGAGDILLLHSDGLADHRCGEVGYVSDRLEETLRRVKHLSARDIFGTIATDVLAFAPPSDDITLVVVKRR